jgi:hypothetical protein
MKSKITNEQIVKKVRDNIDGVCRNQQYIMEYQFDDENGDRIFTLEVYYTDDGYIYDIVYTDELNGETKEIYGKEADELAKMLYGDNLLLD